MKLADEREEIKKRTKANEDVSDTASYALASETGRGGTRQNDPLKGIE